MASSSLSARQQRILTAVLAELEGAISISDARRILEAQNVSARGLGNPDLEPIAFSLRHGTWLTLAAGVVAEILAWAVLFFIILLSILISIPFAVVTQSPGYIGIALSKYRKWFRDLKQSRWTARRMRYNAYRKLRNDERPPVLYLRSFSSDHFYELPELDRRSADERLAEFYEKLGPVIAVAGPGEERPMLGPVRLYFDDEVWKAGVIHLIAVSQLVIIQAGISQGTLWELGIARRILTPEKLIISLDATWNPGIPDIRNYKWFKDYAEEILGTALPVTEEIVGTEFPLTEEIYGADSLDPETVAYLNREENIKGKFGFELPLNSKFAVLIRFGKNWESHFS